MTPALSPRIVSQSYLFVVEHGGEQVEIRIDLDIDGTLFTHENGASPEAVALCEAKVREIVAAEQRRTQAQRYRDFAALSRAALRCAPSSPPASGDGLPENGPQSSRLAPPDAEPAHDPSASRDAGNISEVPRG